MAKQNKAKSFYRIRNGKGHYSTGGLHPSFSAVGKVWSGIGFVKSHLTQYRTAGTNKKLRQIPDDWVIEEIGIVVNATHNARRFVSKDPVDILINMVPNEPKE